MRAIRLIAFMFFVALMACKNENRNDGKDVSAEPDETVTAAPVIPPPGSITGDTINLSGKFVLFFGPVETTDGTQAISPDVIQKFKQTSAALMDSLSVYQDIKAAYSTVGFFTIYTDYGSSMTLTKSALKTPAGILVTDGNQPPTIKKGILTMAEYQQVIRDYFFLQ